MKASMEIDAFLFVLDLPREHAILLGNNGGFPMANILLSFLGTSDYLPCNYYLERDPGRRACGVRFVQEALAHILCAGWDAEDRIVVFLTEKARSANWESRGEGSGKVKGLAESLGGPGMRCAVRDVGICEGFSETQVWDIFQAVFAVLHSGDHVFLDITHAFRSIPMVGMVLLSYARVMKGVTVEAVYYGAFESLGTRSAAESIPLEDRDAPIIDLSSLVELQEWSLAVNAYVDRGDPGGVAGLARRRVAPVLRESRGQDAVAGRVKKFSGALEEISGHFRYCRGRNIVEYDYGAFRENVEMLGRDDVFIRPLPPLFGRIADAFSGYAAGDPLNTVRASRWCLDHGLVQQGITILQEGAISVLCERAGCDPADRQARENVNREVWRSVNGEKRANEEVRAAGEGPVNGGGCGVERLRETLLALPFFAEVSIVMNNLGNLRNDINHGGFRDNPMPARKIEAKAKEYLEKLEVIFRSGKT